MEAEAFAKNFAPYSVPPVLEKLRAFAEGHAQFFSEGFELTRDEKGGLRSWSEDSAFLDRLLPFANATGGGSFYALWVDDATKPTAQMPVVVFGDEGGIHVVAANAEELLGLLTFDAEPMIDSDKTTFYKSPKTHKPSKRFEAFVQWLKTDLGIEPVSDPAGLVTRAQATYQSSFDAFKAPFVRA